MAEQTLVLIKPDGLKKSLTGNILTRLSEAKLEIMAAKVVCVTRELASEHYCHMQAKPFFEELINYLMGNLHDRRKVLALVYHGDNAISLVRGICGGTNPETADPTSIRGAYGRITTKGLFENIIHASSALEEAEREIKLWFKPEELVYRIYPVKTEEKVTKTLVWA
ncbi:nucleoside-diphosphate kinase [bacterium]|nr:nucleoside-diphosphate kinase [bacterium]MBU3955472.1 nucleoside-diphosphate kinase [bacterium]